jgi:hypothetical protein
MLITKKMLLALTLVGALIGAGIGALVTHSASGDARAENTSTAGSQPAEAAVRDTGSTARDTNQVATDNSAQFQTPAEQTAYRQGFNEGYTSCSNAQLGNSSRTTTYPASYRSSVRRYSNGRRVYYDYGNQPRGRTFWQKHRDKLTLAMGTGGGAIIGGLIGGKRGAGIGSLVGLGSSALYTYKIRHRSRRY